MTNIDTYMAEVIRLHQHFYDKSIYPPYLEALESAMLKAARGIAEEAIGAMEEQNILGNPMQVSLEQYAHNQLRSAQLARLDKIVGEASNDGD